LGSNLIWIKFEILQHLSGEIVKDEDKKEEMLLTSQVIQLTLS
jgi:hypothetical protein